MAVFAGALVCAALVIVPRSKGLPSSSGVDQVVSDLVRRAQDRAIELQRTSQRLYMCQKILHRKNTWLHRTFTMLVVGAGLAVATPCSNSALSLNP